MVPALDRSSVSLRSRRELRTDARSDFVFGDAPTLADICLVPQVWNARRFKIPLKNYPTIVGIADRAMALETFKQAEPAHQPDAEQ